MINIESHIHIYFNNEDLLYKSYCRNMKQTVNKPTTATEHFSGLPNSAATEHFSGLPNSAATEHFSGLPNLAATDHDIPVVLWTPNDNTQ